MLRARMHWKIITIACMVETMFLPVGREPGALWVILGTWLLTCLLAEALWHVSLDGRTTLTMGPAAHIAAIGVLPAWWAIAVVTVTSILGAALWRRRSPMAALIRGGFSAVAAACAIGVLVATGDYLPVTACTPCETALADPGRLLGLGLAGLVYLALGQWFRALTTARSLGMNWRSAWRGGFGYETELVTSAALVVLGVLAVFCYATLGYRGIVFCVMPLLFVREGSRRYVELEAAQGKLIQNERLAAKGEMAAEIGHEINNYLAAVSGRAQLILRQGAEEPTVLEESEGVRAVSTQMAELAKGLMDFSYRGVKRTAFGVNELVEKTVEFVRPQKRFNQVSFKFDADPGLPSVEMDPGQIQQVLLTLLGKAADRASMGSSAPLIIRTADDPRKHTVRLEIRTGPLLTPDTAPAEHDPEIGTVHRILERHQGKLERTQDPDGGETFRVLLPAA